MSIRKASAATSINKGLAAARSMTVNDTVRAAGGGPTITNVYVTDSSYTVLDDTAVSTSGGYIKIIGTGFLTGCVVYTQGTAATTTTFVSATEVRAQLPSTSSGTLHLYLVNPDNSAAIYLSGVVFSGVPAWSTDATLTAAYEQATYTQTLTATGDATVSYALKAGSTLPDGVTLNPTTGALSGTTPVVASGSTTYTFTIIAIDGQNQDTERLFSLTINHDIVTWSSPANNTTYTVDADTAINTIALSAASAAGKTITYSVNSLPTGLSLSGANVAGTPTSAGSTTSLITATAANTSATGTILINWVVSVAGDTYFRNTVLLVNGERTTPSFIADVSAGNNAITLAGTSAPSAFSPYNTSWSYYFDGAGDYLTVPYSSSFNLASNTPMTFEAWVFNTTTDFMILACRGWGWGGAGPVIGFGLSNGVTPTWSYPHTGTATYTLATSSISGDLGKWNHYAWNRAANGQCTIYVNGVQGVARTDTNIMTSATEPVFIGVSTNLASPYAKGYMSNMRWIVGSSIYDTAFTPPRTQLTAVGNTVLLTCQSNRIIDNRTSGAVITRYGNTATKSYSPYPETDLTSGSVYKIRTDYLTTPSSANLITFTGDFTLEAWVYPTKTTTGDWGLIDARNSGGAAQNWVWTLTAYSNGFLMNFYTASVARNGATRIPYNAWTHVAAVRTGTTLKYYINGVVDPNTFSLSGTISGAATGDVFLTNSKDYTVSAEWGSEGYITDLRVVNGTGVYTTNFTPPTAPLTAITNTSLLTLQSRNGHNNNTVLDTSGSGLIGTKFANAAMGTFSPFSDPEGYWSNYFDGTGDYLTTGTMTPIATTQSTFTVEAWIYMTAAPSSSGSPNIPAVVGDMDPASGAANWTFGPTTSRTLSFYWYTGSTTSVVGDTIMGLNAWHHIAVSVSLNVISLYVNGLLQTLTGTTTLTNRQSTLNYIGIGQNNLTNHVFRGYISNIRIVSGTAVYLANFTPPTAPLTPIAGTQLITCQSNRFIDTSPNKRAITRSGDTVIQPFSPFASPRVVPTGYYSNHFDGTGDYLQLPSSANLSPGSVFTFEAWIFLPIAAVAGATIYGPGGSAQMQIGYQSASDWGVAARTTAWRLTTTVLPLVGQWNHIAICRGGTGTNQTSFFLNGTRVLLGTLSDAFNTTTSYQVGYDTGGGGQPWNGYISNLRLVTGVDVYGYTNTTITVPTVPLTAIANTQLLTCQSERMVDNSNNAFTITPNGDARVQAFNQFTSPKNSIGYYSNYFDGTGDYLTLTAGVTNFGTADFTVEYYVYFTAAVNSNYQAHVGTSTTSTGVAFGTASNGGLGKTMCIYATTSASTLATGDTALIRNSWNHIVWTRSGTTLRGFLNGILSAYATSISTNFNETGCGIGANKNGTFAFAGGYISNVRVVSGSVLTEYTTANTTLGTVIFTPPTAPLTTTVSAGTVQLLTCRSDQFIDNSNNASTITRNGETSISPAAPFVPTRSAGYYSNSFDGTGDYLTVPSNAAFQFGTDNFTIEAWIFNTSAGATDKRILVNWGGGSGAWQFYLRTNNRLVWQVYSQNSPDSATLDIPLNVWTHVAWCRSGSSAYLFINGVLKDTTTLTNSANGTGTNVAIGSDNAGGSYFFGNISNLRVVKGAAVYTTNFIPSTTPPTTFVSSGTVSLLTCRSDQFIDNSDNTFTVTRNGNVRIDSSIPFTPPSTYGLPVSTYTESYNGGSGYYDGTGDYHSFPLVLPMLGNFTFECWVYGNNSISGMAICGSDLFELFLSTLSVNWVYQGVIQVSSGINLVPGQWNHIVVCRYNWVVNAAGLFNIFVNGQKYAGATAKGESMPIAGPFITGGSYYTNALRNPWPGYISNVRFVSGNGTIYTTAFTPPVAPVTPVPGTVLQLDYTSAGMIDQSGQNNLESVGDVRINNAVKKYNAGSMYFDGTLDCLTLNSNTPSLNMGTGDFTVEFWIYRLNNNCGIFKPVGAGSSSNGPQISGTSKFGWWKDGSNEILVSTTTASTSTWYHVAYSRAGTSFKLFVNGILESTVTNSDSFDFSAWSIGRGYYDNQFNGYIDDFRITKGVARYVANFTPPTAAFIAK